MRLIDADAYKKYLDENWIVANYDAIDAQPTVQPEQKWIPCSERLPEEIGSYMTTLNYGMHGLAVGQRFNHGKWYGWEDDCVIAWMPMPKPYERRKDMYGGKSDDV